MDKKKKIKQNVREKKVFKLPKFTQLSGFRGIFVEGLGVTLAGVFGTGTGTTSFSENVAIIGITRVASRRVSF